jgi:hypothetical protein
MQRLAVATPLLFTSVARSRLILERLAGGHTAAH